MSESEQGRGYSPLIEPKEATLSDSDTALVNYAFILCELRLLGCEVEQIECRRPSYDKLVGLRDALKKAVSEHSLAVERQLKGGEEN